MFFLILLGLCNHVCTYVWYALVRAYAYVCVCVCIYRSTYIMCILCLIYIVSVSLRECMCQNARVHLQNAMSEQTNKERDKLKADSITYNYDGHAGIDL